MSRKRLAQEAFGRRQVTVFAEEELDRVADAVDGSIEIHPLATDLDVGSLIDRQRSVSLSLISATCKVLFEVIPFGASSRHPRRRLPKGLIRDALARM